MRHGSSSHQICRTRADAGADSHDALAKLRLAVRNSRQSHALLVVRAISGQLCTVLPKRFTQSCHVAMPEYRKDATAIRLYASIIQFNTLRGKVANKRLGHG
jgi:hypothetical protein